MNVKTIALFAAVAAVSSTQNGAVPVEQEPNHRTVLKNDYVQVFRVQLEPVDSAVTHTLANEGSEKGVLVEIELK
ncbi:MAG: hypothetical protein PT977_07730 [Acidobacteriota bacterium]|nr:hypothetical protein [Acidobacteriota bacterium]